VAETRWLTYKEAAERVRLDVATLRRAVKRGALVAFRVNGGHRVRLRAEDVDAWQSAFPTKAVAS
jgi:excisionase family DNA binding protein